MHLWCVESSAAPGLLLERLCLGLEPEQVEVLHHDFSAQGPLLVLAGAGTGKTTVLTRRIAWECAQGTPADRIMALTFTRKASREMRERVERIVGPGREAPQVRTFHSLGLAILSEDGGLGWTLAGWKRTPRLMDDDLLSREFALFWKERFRLGGTSAPSPGEWTRTLARHGRPEDANGSEAPWIDDWSAWEAYKREREVAEHHDLLGGALSALERDEGLRLRWQERSQTLLVDEYQDTDRTQYRLVSLLSAGSDRVLAVGDDDQSIYGFRGADLRNVLDWREDRPHGRILTMTANHRSLSPVISVANLVFPDKPEAFRKVLRSRRREAGEERAVWYRAADQDEETTWIHDRIAHELRRGRARADLCLLSRSNRDRDRLERELPPWARGVQASTIHGAKGLEWPVVVVCGQDRPRSEGNALARFESDEERRLFYVACTRARDRLLVSSCDRRPRGDLWEERVPHPWMRLVSPEVEKLPGLWGRLGRHFLRQGE